MFWDRKNIYYVFELISKMSMNFIQFLSNWFPFTSPYLFPLQTKIYICIHELYWIFIRDIHLYTLLSQIKFAIIINGINRNKIKSHSHRSLWAKHICKYHLIVLERTILCVCQLLWDIHHRVLLSLLPSPQRCCPIPR